MRKYFLEDFYHADKSISYKRSVGNTIRFICDGINGSFEVVDYVYDKDTEKESILINYQGENSWLKARNIRNNFFPFVKNKAIRNKLPKINFKYEIGENIVDENRDIKIIKKYSENRDTIRNGKTYTKRLKYYDFYCNTCGYTNNHVVEESLCHQNSGCPCCSHKITVTGINDLTITDPWMIPYFQGGYEEAKLYTAYSNKKVTMICPDCKKTKIVQISKLKQHQTISCSCGDGYSYPEKFFLALLNQTDVNYDFQKNFDWCVFYNHFKNKEVTGRYDFYIESLNLIIETDGSWHKNDNTLSGQSKEESMFIDNEKDKLASINGFKVIRIDCSVSSKDYISNSLKHSILNEYFDLSGVDYEECNMYAMSNLRKCVVDEYKNDNALTATDLSMKHKISTATICTWLRREGINPRERANKLKRVPNVHTMKPVRISEDGINYKTYESVVSLAENFEKDFGCKGSYGSIWYCIKNNKTYKGKIVEYVA